MPRVNSSSSSEEDSPVPLQQRVVEKLPAEVTQLYGSAGLDQMLARGLSSNQVKQLQKKMGYNESIRQAGPVKTVFQFVLKFLLKFWGVSAWILELTAMCSFVLAFVPSPNTKPGESSIHWRNIAEGCIVIVLLMLNAVLSIIQEVRAARAVEALKKRLQVKCRVLRDGQWKADVLARELVPGDIIYQRTGDLVPADLVFLPERISSAPSIDGIVHQADLSVDVDQSALTGESNAVTRTPGEKIFAGSMIRRGEFTGIVVSTGTRTYFGRTAELVQFSKPKMHIDSVINRFTFAMLAIVGIMVALSLAMHVFFVLGWSKSLQRPSLFLELVPLFLVMLLAAIPVGLPAMFTITMALGSSKLIKHGALVSRLSATEDAAAMDILCCDKTGTLTNNKLQIAGIVSQGDIASDIATYGASSSQQLVRFNDDDVILLGALASREQNRDDPIDQAFIEQAHARSRLLSAVRDEYELIAFEPFDPNQRRTIATVRHKPSNEIWKVSKGSVKKIMRMCEQTMGSEMKDRLEHAVADFSKRGGRTIAVAVARHQNDYELVGVVSLLDTPRQDAKSVVDELRYELGVRFLMLTGDHLSVAVEIAKQVGLSGNIVNLKQLRKNYEEHSDDEKSSSELVARRRKSLAQMAARLVQHHQRRAGARRRRESIDLKSQISINLGQDSSDAGQSNLDLEAQPLLTRTSKSSIPYVDGFAEVYPEDKFQIVRSLQASGCTVGMTGDGINDAPSLRAAEVGVAVSSATDVAKGAASVVLTKEGLSGLPHVIRVGRQIHQRVVTWVLNKVVKTFMQVIFVNLAFFVFKTYVVSALHVLVLLFSLDFVTLALATDNASYSKRPERWRMLRLVGASAFVGTASVIEAFGLLICAMHLLGYGGPYFLAHHDHSSLQTFSFMMLFFFGIFNVFIVRERGFFWQGTRPGRMLLIVAAIDSVLALLLSMFGLRIGNIPIITPILKLWHAPIVILYTAVCTFLINDVIKTFAIKLFRVSMPGIQRTEPQVSIKPQDKEYREIKKGSIRSIATAAAQTREVAVMRAVRAAATPVEVLAHQYAAGAQA